MLEQGRPREPRCPRAQSGDVVAMKGAEGYGMASDVAEDPLEFGANVLEDIAAEIDQVHLVHGKDELLDAEQSGDSCMAT